MGEQYDSAVHVLAQVLPGERSDEAAVFRIGDPHAHRALIERIDPHVNLS